MFNLINNYPSTFCWTSYERFQKLCYLKTHFPYIGQDFSNVWVSSSLLYCLTSPIELFPLHIAYILNLNKMNKIKMRPTFLNYGKQQNRLER